MTYSVRRSLGSLLFFKVEKDSVAVRAKRSDTRQNGLNPSFLGPHHMEVGAEDVQ